MRNPLPAKAHRKKKEPIRLIGLSDGLFATVLTLLVLDLKTPEAFSPNSPLDFIRWVSPHFFSYLLTFLVAGTYWLTHHRDFEHVIWSDRTLLSYNLLFLLFVGLFPFSTAAISPISFANNAYPFYWAIYAGNVLLAGMMLALIWIYAVTHGFVDTEVTQREYRHIRLRQFAIPVIFLISIGMEFLFPKLFLGPFTLFLVPPTLWIIDLRYKANSHAPEGKPNLLWRTGRVVPWFVIVGLAVWAMLAK